MSRLSYFVQVFFRGKFYGDRGYISKALAAELRNHGVVLITKLKKI